MKTIKQFISIRCVTVDSFVDIYTKKNAPNGAFLNGWALSGRQGESKVQDFQCF